MLNTWAYENIKLIEKAAKEVWGDNVEFGEVQVIDSMYPAFERNMVLYGKHKVLLEYELSTFALKLWTGKKYKHLDDFTKEKMIYGFDSMIPENIVHNFKILDGVVGKRSVHK